jgi:methyltransferase
LIVAVHIAWLATLAVLGWNASMVLPRIAVVAILQLLRVWVIWSLGPLWTTRVIVIGRQLVRRGPYRFMRHPAYAIAAAELAAVPTTFARRRAWGSGLAAANRFDEPPRRRAPANKAGHLCG